jgi:hypothetical protein
MAATKKKKASTKKARSITGKEWRQIRLAPGAVFRDLKLTDCTIDNCHVAGTEYTTFERVSLTRTKARVNRLDKVICRDVTIEELRSGREPTFLTNCLFDRVMLRGFIGDLMMNLRPEYLSAEEKKLAAAFYDGVEWALDLREATFGSLQLYPIPGELVRIDPKRHCLVDKAKLRADPSWQDLDEVLAFSLEQLLEGPGKLGVLVAGERSKYFEDWKKDHATLRARGFALP